jgi:hypothetical protein
MLTCASFSFSIGPVISLECDLILSMLEEKRRLGWLKLCFI